MVAVFIDRDGWALTSDSCVTETGAKPKAVSGLNGLLGALMQMLEAPPPYLYGYSLSPELPIRNHEVSKQRSLCLDMLYLVLGTN